MIPCSLRIYFERSYISGPSPLRIYIYPTCLEWTSGPSHYEYIYIYIYSNPTRSTSLLLQLNSSRLRHYLKDRFSSVNCPSIHFTYLSNCFRKHHIISWRWSRYKAITYPQPPDWFFAVWRRSKLITSSSSSTSRLVLTSNPNISLSM